MTLREINNILILYGSISFGLRNNFVNVNNSISVLIHKLDTSLYINFIAANVKVTEITIQSIDNNKLVASFYKFLIQD